MTDIPPTPVPAPTPAPASPAALTFEQQAVVNAQVEAAKAEATKQAAAAEQARIASYLAEQQAAIDLAGASELVRAQAAQAAAEAKAAEATATAATTLAQSRAQAALLTAGMPPEQVTDGLLLIGLVSTDDEAALKTKAEALKVRQPTLFTAAAAPTPAPHPGFTPAKPPATAAQLGGKSITDYGNELRKDLRLPTAS